MFHTTIDFWNESLLRVWVEQFVGSKKVDYYIGKQLMVTLSNTGCEGYHYEVTGFVGVTFIMDDDDFAGIVRRKEVMT